MSENLAARWERERATFNDDAPRREGDVDANTACGAWGSSVILASAGADVVGCD